MSEYLFPIDIKKPQSINQSCKKSHVPNKETAKILRETDEGKNLEGYESLDHFWKALGLDQQSI